MDLLKLGFIQKVEGDGRSPKSYEPKIVRELVFPTNSTNKIWGIF